MENALPGRGLILFLVSAKRGGGRIGLPGSFMFLLENCLSYRHDIFMIFPEHSLGTLFRNSEFLASPVLSPRRSFSGSLFVKLRIFRHLTLTIAAARANVLLDITSQLYMMLDMISLTLGHVFECPTIAL